MFSDFVRERASQHQLCDSVPASTPPPISHSILDVPSSSSIFDNNFRVSVADNTRNAIFVCGARAESFFHRVIKNLMKISAVRCLLI